MKVFCLAVVALLLTTSHLFGQNTTDSEAPTSVVGSQPTDLESQASGSLKRDRAYDKNDLYQKRPIPYDNIREADVFWEKRVWRMIDFREKLNLPFANPKEPFAEIIIDNILKGELEAFSALDDEFTLRLDKTTLENKLYKTDTSIWLTEEGFMDTAIYQTTPDYAEYQKIRIKEDWIFDEETSTMQVRIIGLGLMKARVDPLTGDVLGDEMMFWVYYPDLRNILINHEAFNPHNDGIAMTWDDVMEMRMFSSYVIKESNVYDRSIEDYLTGIDAVLEGEEIKGEIFRFEHEVWEY